MEYNEAFGQNAFKPITENPIILDFTGCRYAGEIHLRLKTKFGLPEYYGENWDALWDCLDGLFYQRGDFEVHILGFNSLPEELKTYCAPMMEIFRDVHNEAPNVTFKLIS